MSTWSAGGWESCSDWISGRILICHPRSTRRENVGIKLGSRVHLRSTSHRGSVTLVDAEMILDGAMIRVRDLIRVADDWEMEGSDLDLELVGWVIINFIGCLVVVSIPNPLGDRYMYVFQGSRLKLYLGRCMTIRTFGSRGLTLADVLLYYGY